MKVVHLVNLDILGGAAKAAFALNKALLYNNVDSALLVQTKFSSDKDVYSISGNFIDKLKANARIIADLIQMNALTKTKKGRFSFGTIGTDIAKNKLIRQSDLIHLHWINQGYLSLSSLSNLALLNKPVVWTLHDMWGFTGGCHYSSGCRNYLNSCGDCPYLIFSSAGDFSHHIFLKKKKIYDQLKINFITCSEWLANIARKAPLLKDKIVTPIHNTLDIDVYKSLDKGGIRRKFNLPENKFLILFVALSITEERKGFSYLKNSLIRLLERYPHLKSEIELLILGRSSAENFEGISLKINQLGRIKSEKEIAECYNASDIFLAPSLEDNLPNTVLESLSCGIPVVAFKIGGIPEMVDHLKNGYLSEERSIEDFANGIYWMFQNK
ncbi:MAG TPA: glycosyltransferase, partial [Ignavibacteriaceae bacterium]|nr:glycosyltransferase [Ignavibacteriaceae bacterium]